MKLEELKIEGFLLERASGAIHFAETDILCAEDFEQDGSIVKQQKLVSKMEAKELLDNTDQLDVKGYKVIRESGVVHYKFSLDIDSVEYEAHGGIMSYIELVPYYQIKHILENPVKQPVLEVVEEKKGLISDRLKRRL